VISWRCDTETAKPEIGPNSTGEDRGLPLESPAPDAAGKAAFFMRQGFTVEAWEIFEDALRGLAASGSFTMRMDSPHGTKYIVDGLLTTPVGKTPLVRTIWIVDQGGKHPRLVTAYPYEKGD